MSASENIKNQNIIDVVALALVSVSDQKYMLARRGPGGSGAGDWEFPGGKIEPGESQNQALRREIIEELGYDLEGKNLVCLGENLHDYGNRLIRIYLWRAETDTKPEFQLVDHDKTGWFSREEIEKINLSEGDKYFISLI